MTRIRDSLKGLAVALGLMVPATAMAQPTPLSGFYVGASVGPNWLQNEHIIGRQGRATDGSLSSNVGMVGVLTLGYAVPNTGLRLELEGDFRNNSLSGAHDLGFPATAGGRERKFGPMFNVLYELGPTLANFGINTPVSPYVGAGVGYSWNRLIGLHVNGLTPGSPSFGSDTQTRGAIAYQAIFGVAYELPVPGLALTTEYRFFGTGSRSYDVTTTTGARGSVKLGNDFNHSLLLGVRYSFGGAPAPAPTAPTPVAAPAPAAARSYLVFFDWDKANLTDRARQIIRDAADSSTRVQYTRIEVNGYTDTSGTPQYNKGLSMRRAQAVEGELVRDGVPQSAISVQGLGDTNLLVPTGQGVREPQNRRVEIIVH